MGPDGYIERLVAQLVGDLRIDILALTGEWNGMPNSQLILLDIVCFVVYFHRQKYFMVKTLGRFCRGKINIPSFQINR